MIKDYKNLTFIQYLLKTSFNPFLIAQIAIQIIEFFKKQYCLIEQAIATVNYQ